MSKADNMLAILWLLKSRKRVTARQLADELEIHIRSVYRNIDALCASGVPIYAETGRSGGYRLPDDFAEAPLFFDPDEQKALVHAAAIAQETGYPLGDALSRAVSKLKRYANPEQLDHIQRHETVIEAVHSPADPERNRILNDLEEAVAGRKTLTIEYRSGYDGSPSNRSFDPYGLVHWKGKWYIIGFCHLREEIRNFRVDRILSLSQAGTTFERPPGFSARQFLLDSLLPDSEDEHSDALISVVIEGQPGAIDDLCGHWLLSHALIERAADRAQFQLDELSLFTQVPYLLLSYGGRIRVLEPARLKETLTEIAASLFHYYRTT